MRMTMFWGGIGVLSCFFSIIAIPFASIPITVDSLMLCVLYPLHFFLGSVAFFIGFISHSMVLHQLRILKSVSPIKTAFGVLIFLSPIVLIIYSLKMVLVFFLFSLMYAKLSARPLGANRRNIRNY